jgi:hypothetical protein
MGEPGSILKHSSWSLKLGLQLSDSVRMVLHPEEQVVGLQYTKAFKVSHDCKAVRVPTPLITQPSFLLARKCGSDYYFETFICFLGEFLVHANWVGFLCRWQQELQKYHQT